jgi:hypothetical protein
MIAAPSEDAGEHAHGDEFGTLAVRARKQEIAEACSS